MDIYRFMNSRNVAAHLRGIGYEFSAFEAAYLVEICDDATLDEKIAAWQEIIDTMPDCPTAYNHEIERRESTHGLLREYIELQKRILGMFGDGEGFVYLPRKMRYAEWPEWLAGDGRDLWVEDLPHPFSSLEKCIEYLRAEREDDGDDFDRYVIGKAKVDCAGDSADLRNNEIVLDGDFRPLEVSIGDLGERDRELGWSLRDAFVELPVPFRTGDIVIDRTDPRPHPFVFDCLKFWNSRELAEHGGKQLAPDRAARLDARVARCSERHSWDVSHMVACGYELGGDYDGGPLADPCDLCFDVFGACGNYLNLEYYEEPLDGNLGMLDVAAKYMKGEIGAEDVMGLARAISLETHASRLRGSYDSEYWETGYLYAGKGAPYIEEAGDLIQKIISELENGEIDVGCATNFARLVELDERASKLRGALRT